MARGLRSLLRWKKRMHIYYIRNRGFGNRFINLFGDDVDNHGTPNDLTQWPRNQEGMWLIQTYSDHFGQFVKLIFYGIQKVSWLCMNCKTVSYSFVIELGIIATNLQLESKGCPNYCIGDLKPKSQIVFRMHS